MRRNALLSCLLTVLAGCSLAPPLSTPSPGLPGAYPAPAAVAPETIAAHELEWQQFFRDAQLRQLIALALENNQDLAAATARIAQAEAAYRIQDSLRMPSLAASVTTQRVGSPSPAGGRITSDSSGAQVAIPSFELDFWGRLANLGEAARRQYLATVEAQKAFRLSLVGSVATAYFILRASEDGIDLARRTLDSRRETLDLARLRMEAGLTSSVDYDQSHALVNQAETQLTQFVQTRDQAQNWLRALTGTDAEAILQGDGVPVGDAGQLAPFAAGLPSDLLAQRPDIRLAEHRIAAANASIGAARAAYFPSISLTGSAGYASSELSDLFSSGSRVWSVGAGALLPVLDFGRRKAQVRLAEAELDEREAAYLQAVRNAFRESLDGLDALRANTDRIAALERSVAVQASLAATAQSRYDVGLSPYLEVLDAERGLFSAQQALLQAQAGDLQDRVNLYLALGGGDLATAAR